MSLQDRFGQLPFPFGGSWPAERNGLRRSSLQQPRTRGNNLFLALKPPFDIAQSMHEAAARHAIGRTARDAYPADLLHMTLLHLGAYTAEPRSRIDRISRLCERIATGPIPILLNRGSIFGNGKDLVLTAKERNPPLSEFVRGLRGTFGYHGLLAAGGASFNPHVTVIYGCGRIEPLVPERSYDWVADRFTLVYSHYGKGRHDEFGPWRLRPGAAAFPAPEQLDLGF